MDIYSDCLSLINDNLIRVSTLTAVVLIFARWLYPNKRALSNATFMLMCILVVYTAFLDLFWRLQLAGDYFSSTDYIQYTLVGVGQNWWAFWTSIVCCMILPLLLVIKRFGRNIYIVLLATLIINIPSFFLLFSILVADMSINNLQSGKSAFSSIFLLGLQGMFIGVLLIFIGRLHINKQHVSLSREK